VPPSGTNVTAGALGKEGFVGRPFDEISIDSIAAATERGTTRAIPEHV